MTTLLPALAEFSNFSSPSSPITLIQSVLLKLGSNPRLCDAVSRLSLEQPFLDKQRYPSFEGVKWRCHQNTAEQEDEGPGESLRQLVVLKEEPRSALWGPST